MLGLDGSAFLCSQSEKPHYNGNVRAAVCSYRRAML
jgi:hypothetical protein